MKFFEEKEDDKATVYPPELYEDDLRIELDYGHILIGTNYSMKRREKELGINSALHTYICVSLEEEEDDTYITKEEADMIIAKLQYAFSE